MFSMTCSQYFAVPRRALEADQLSVEMLPQRGGISQRLFIISPSAASASSAESAAGGCGVSLSDHWSSGPSARISRLAVSSVVSSTVSVVVVSGSSDVLLLLEGGILLEFLLDEVAQLHDGQLEKLEILQHLLGQMHALFLCAAGDALPCAWLEFPPSGEGVADDGAVGVFEVCCRRGCRARCG